MIKIACHTLTWANFYKKYSIKEALKEIKNLGYDGVELVEPLSIIGEADPFKEYLNLLGLELVSLSCSLDEEAKKRIDFLKHFDTNVVMLCTDWIAKSGRRHGLLIQSLRGDLESIAKYAEKQNKNVAFHPHKNTLIETKEDLEDFYSEPTPVRLCLDVGHIAACGSDPLEVLKEFRNKITYIHLKDYDRRKGQFVELGRGDIDLKPILSYLRDNYTGWVTVELDFTVTDPVQSAQTSRKYLKNMGF